MITKSPFYLLSYRFDGFQLSTSEILEKISEWKQKLWLCYERSHVLSGFNTTTYVSSLQRR